MRNIYEIILASKREAEGLAQGNSLNGSIPTGSGSTTFLFRPFRASSVWLKFLPSLTHPETSRHLLLLNLEGNGRGSGWGVCYRQTISRRYIPEPDFYFIQKDKHRSDVLGGRGATRCPVRRKQSREQVVLLCSLQKLDNVKREFSLLRYLGEGTVIHPPV